MNPHLQPDGVNISKLVNDDRHRFFWAKFMGYCVQARQAKIGDAVKETAAGLAVEGIG